MPLTQQETGKNKMCETFEVGDLVRCIVPPLGSTITEGEIYVVYKLLPFNLDDPNDPLIKVANRSTPTVPIIGTYFSSRFEHENKKKIVEKVINDPLHSLHYFIYYPERNSNVTKAYYTFIDRDKWDEEVNDLLEQNDEKFIAGSATQAQIKAPVKAEINLK